MQERDRTARDIALILIPEDMHVEVVKHFETMETAPAENAFNSLMWMKTALSDGRLHKDDFLAGLLAGIGLARASGIDAFQALVKDLKKEKALAKGANVVSFVGKKTEQK